MTEYCCICGRPAECTHHFIFGRGWRNLADEDDVFAPMCNNCHNMGEITRRIHDNSMAEQLSKMFGQMMWERNYLAHDDEAKAEARQAFIKRYGRSWL